MSKSVEKVKKSTYESWQKALKILDLRGMLW